MDTLADVLVAHLGQTVGAKRIAEVDDFQPVENLQPVVHVIRARFIGGGPDCPRTEPGARPVRCRQSNGAPTMATSGRQELKG